MSPIDSALDTYIEVGSKRVFAGAIEWPGWCRRGTSAGSALEALVDAAPRYAAVVKGVRPAFRAPKGVDDLRIVERVQGNATTDFGAPSITPELDRRPVDAEELARLRNVLEASWAAFDAAAEGASGMQLSTGPRGGGRTLAKIVSHVVEAEAAYTRKILGRPPSGAEGPGASAMAREVRAVVLAALERAVTDGLPEAGPRGGKLWTPRYFVRRAAWHVLDHAWEIEDRSYPEPT